MDAPHATVTSAFRRGVLSPPYFGVDEVTFDKTGSPVPFGVGCYHPCARTHQRNPCWNGVTSAFRRGVLSPQVSFKIASHKRGVTSAFRRGVLSPRANCRETVHCVWRLSPVPFGVGCYHPSTMLFDNSLRKWCHQCLSAWGAFTPT